LKAFATFVVLAAGAALAAAPLTASAEGVLTAETAAGAGPRAGTVTGTISLGGLTPGATFQLVNAYQVQPDAASCTSTCADRFLPGTYNARFTNCVGGLIAGETEVIRGGGTFSESPGEPPDHSGPFTLALAEGSSSTTCDYSVRISRSALGSAISSIRSVRLDVWVLSAGQVLGRVASPSVHADWNADPAVLPEPPFAALLPASALVVMGGALVLLSIRRRPAWAA
jgi:hypothetical protein